MHVAIDSFGQRSEGTWRMSWHPVFDDGSTGERVWETIKAKTRRDAKRQAGEIRAKRDEELRECQGSPAPHAGVTLLEWAQRLVDERLATGVIRQSTADSYMVRIRSCGTIGQMDVAEITTDDALECLIEMNKRGNLCRNTVISNFKTLRSALEHAVDEDLIAKNPARRITLPEALPTKPRSLRSDELDRLIEVMDAAENPMKSCIALGIYLGVRGEEACGFQWLDRDPNEGVPIISIDRVAIIEQGRIVVKEPKTPSSIRTLPEAPRLTHILDEREKEQRERCERHGVKFDKSFFILGDIDGRPLSPDTMRKMFRTLCDCFGLDCSYHWLRHTLATYLHRRRVPPSAIAAWLGHASPAFTERVYCDKDPTIVYDALPVVSGIGSSGGERRRELLGDDDMA